MDQGTIRSYQCTGRVSIFYGELSIWYQRRIHMSILRWSGSILESKGMRAIYQKTGKTRTKKGKIFKIFDKTVQNLKIFWKRQPHPCDYRVHETARIYPGDVIVIFGRFQFTTWSSSHCSSTFERQRYKKNPAKCRFFQKEVNLLDRVITEDGYQVDSKNISAVKCLATKSPKISKLFLIY